MVSLVPEMICGGCNSSYGAFALNYPCIWYASGPTVLIHDLKLHRTVDVLQGHKSSVNCVACVGPYILTGGTDKKLIVWEGMALCKEIVMSSSVIHITHGSNLVAAITNDGLLSILLADNFSAVQVLNFSKNLQETCAIQRFREVDVLATGGVDSRIHIYTKSTQEFQYKTSLEGHLRNIRSLSFRVSSELFLASAGQDSFIRIWRFSEDLVESKLIQNVYQVDSMKCRLDAVLSGHTNLVSSVIWINDELLSSSHDFTVVLWHEDPSSNTWTAKSTFGQIGGNKNIFIGALGFENHIVAYTYSGGFYHWVYTTEKWVTQIAPTGHFNIVTDIEATGEYVVTCSLDQTCRLWTFYEGSWAEMSRPMVHGYDINGITLAGGQLVSGADEKIIRVFDPSLSTAEILAKQGKTLNASIRGSSQVLGLTTKMTSEQEIDFSDIIVTEDILNSYTLWPEANKLYGHGYEVTVVTANHLGNIVASACRSQTREHSKVILWDMQSKQKIGDLEFHNLDVTDISFSPNDEYLLTVSRDRSWCLYWKNEGYIYKASKQQAHGRIVYTCCWNPDNNNFATGSRDKKLMIWNTDGVCIKNINFNTGITAACYIDAKIIACGLESGEIKLTNTEDSTMICSVFHGDSITKLKYLSNKLYSISADHTFRIHLINYN